MTSSLTSHDCPGPDQNASACTYGDCSFSISSRASCSVSTGMFGNIHPAITTSHKVVYSDISSFTLKS